MPRRTTLALRFSCLTPLLLPMLITGCTKGGGLIEGFGSYTGPGGGEGTDDGDGDTDDDENDDDEDDGGPGGPLDDGGEDPSADEDTGPPPAGDGDCCVGQETPGCNDPVIAECVCAQDAFCCESVWDDLCASLVVENGCGICEDAGDDGATGGPAEEGGVEEGGATEGGVEEGGATEGGVEEGGVEEGGVEEGGVEEGGGEAGGDAGDCCVAHPGTGCGDATIEACVCGQDDYCCATEWDDICVGEVDSFGCGMCGAGEEGGVEEGGGTEGGVEEGGATEGGAGEGGGGIGDCCAAQATPGCAEPDVEACVCAADDYCCTTAWDDICVGEVDSLGCGVCGGAAEEGGAGEGGGASNCCAAHPETGCTDPEIEACVCAADDYCCVTEWDDICVGEVDSLGCGVC